MFRSTRGMRLVGDGHERDLQKNGIALGLDQSVPREVADLLDGDAVATGGERDPSACHISERTHRHVVDRHMGVVDVAFDPQRYGVRGAGGQLTRRGGHESSGQSGTDEKVAEQAHPLYSHSMVAGGLDEMSYTTRLTPFTSLIIRVEMRANKSCGS